MAETTKQFSFTYAGPCTSQWVKRHILDSSVSLPWNM